MMNNIIIRRIISFMFLIYLISCGELREEDEKSYLSNIELIVNCSESAEVILLKVEVDENGILVEQDIGYYSLSAGKNTIPIPKGKFIEMYTLRFPVYGDIDYSDFRGDYLNLVIADEDQIEIEIGDLSNVLISSHTSVERIQKIIEFEQFNLPLIDLYRGYLNSSITEVEFHDRLSYLLLVVNQRKFNFLRHVDDCVVAYVCYNRMFSDLSELRKHNRRWVKSCYDQEGYIFKPVVYKSLDKLISSKARDKEILDTIGYSINDKLVVHDPLGQSSHFLLFSTVPSIYESLIKISEDQASVDVIIVDYFELDEKQIMEDLRIIEHQFPNLDVEFIKPTFPLIEKVRLQGTPETFRILGDGSFYSLLPPN